MSFGSFVIEVLRKKSIFVVGQLRCPMTKVEIIYEIRTKMRKKLYILSLALLCAFVAVAQTPWYKTDSVSLGKELPRGDVVSYASADDAVRKTFHKSQYLVPLTEFTKESYRADYNNGEEAIKYTTSYKLPFAWLALPRYKVNYGCEAYTPPYT